MWAVLVFAALSVSAQAHGTIPGMNEAVGGFLHPLITPLHVLILLGLGLWLGQQTPLRLKIPVLVFTPCSAAALLATTTGAIPAVPPAFLLAISLSAGVLVALAARLPTCASVALFGFAGLALGLDSAVDNATTTAAIAKTLLGTWISLSVWLVNTAFYVSLCPPRQWIQIGIRVAGSWIVAISLLVLAFSLKR